MFQKFKRKKRVKSKRNATKERGRARAAGIDIAEQDDGKRAQEAGEEESRGCGDGGFWRERNKGGGGGVKKFDSGSAERFERANTKGGSFPFESDTLTVGGTSGVSGQTRIVPDADEKQRERRGENAGIRVEGTV